MHFEISAKTTQTVPIKVSAKLPIEHYEKREFNEKTQKLQNYGQMWKNEQEKFFFHEFDKMKSSEEIR